MRHQILPFGLSDRQQPLTNGDDVDLLLGRPFTGTAARGLLEHEIPDAEGENQTDDKAEATHQNNPTILPSGPTSMASAAGTLGRPGIVMISPQMATTNSAPAESRTSRTLIV